MKRICLGLVGDFSEKIHTHVALNNAIGHCRQHLTFPIETNWIPTLELTGNGFRPNEVQGCWIVPGSPYNNDEGVINTIQWARENNFPLLGSCGGFQYMILEYVRNVLGIEGAAHAETDPQSEKQVISKLSCSLIGRQEDVFIRDRDSWLYHVLNTDKISGHFYCSYGFNAVYKSLFDESFSFTAFSSDGEVRACEIKSHPFYNGTLFQPPLDSTADRPNPLIMDFFRTCYEAR